jgi:hypothetical protein
VISADDLRELLDYDPVTGVFTWRLKLHGKMRGLKAGCPDSRGYIRIKVRQRLLQGHRLAWLHVHGAWPAEEIDHINGDPSDNRIANLRLATHEQNCANTRRRCNNTSGFKGVHWNAQRRKWQAAIRVNGKSRHLGLFTCPVEAASAYNRVAAESFGEFAKDSTQNAPPG